VIVVSIDYIRYISEICKIKFTDDELEDFIQQFTGIIEYVDKLKEVNTEGVVPTYFVNSNTQPLREDVIRDGLSKEDVIRNAPEEEYGYFKLLNVMD